MVSDELAKQWHERAARGESLAAEEQAQLDEWYALQDSAEGRMLGLTTTEKTLATLRAQVDAALAQLLAVTKRIQAVAAENENLRRDIASLRRQLTQSPAPQIA